MDSLTALWDSCFDLSAPLVFFPVRHHSPACSLHLKRTLEAYRPDAILVEGPADSGHLLPHIGHPANKAPLCVYYSHSWKEELDGETVERRSACYYPMLDFSPELIAIRYGMEQEVETRFIDLPYSALSRTEQTQREGKPSYYDDYYLHRSLFIRRLCEKQGCRHYGELWEKLFELGAAGMDTRRFVRSVLALCHYSRVEYTPEMLAFEGNTRREGYMAAQIKKAAVQFGRVLVVTGGFHTAALAELVAGDAAEEPVNEGADAYLVPYSFAESDQLAGYASGMPYPAFYQRVWENLTAGEGGYNEAVREFLVRIGSGLRRKKESVSIADELAAVRQADGLARLRGKPCQGVFELLDGVQSAYLKGDNPAASAAMLEMAVLTLRGDRMGEIASGVEQVPLLLDARAEAKRLRLKIDRTLRQDITLELLAKPLHREASVFFHRLDFLQVGFAEKKAGPDYQNRDTARVREKWRYAWSARVEARLIDVSYLGGTVREAAATSLARRKQEHTGCGALSGLLLSASVMELTEQVAPLEAAMQASIAEDGSFFSLTEAAGNLLFLEDAKWLLNLPDNDEVQPLLGQVLRKAAAILPTLATAQEDEDRELANALKTLHRIARDPEEQAILAEALEELCAGEAPPCLQGAAAGLLYASGRLDAAGVLGYARAYLYGTSPLMKLSGRFLSGVFLSAWDIVFADDGFLLGLGNVLRELSDEDFLHLLPDLRLAFSAFAPRQIDRVAERVGDLFGFTREDVRTPGVSEELLRLGRELDHYAVQYGEGEH